MEVVTFDPWADSAEQEAKREPIVPVWSLAELKKSRTSKAAQIACLEWINHAYDTLTKKAVDRTNTQIKNLALYKGIHFWSQDKHADFRDDRGVEIDTQKIIVNELYDLTENYVSKMTRFKPATVPVPATNEQRDKAGTEVVKAVLDTIAYENDFDGLMMKMQRYSRIFGYQPVLIRWDPDKGPRRGEKAIGDIRYDLPLPWQIILDPQTRPEDVDWMIYFHYEHIEKVKVDYPDVPKDMLQPASGAYQFDMGELSAIELPDHLLVLEFWHRSNKYLPKGLYFKCTPEVMLVLPEDNEYEPLDSSPWGESPH